MDLSGPIISSIKDILSLSSRNIFSIAFFVGIVGLTFLHLPQNVIELFYIDDFRITNRELIGQISFAALAIASSGFCYNIINWISKAVQNKHRSHRRSRRKIDTLRNLTPVECLYLCEYIVSNSQTAYFPISDGVAGGLEAKGIIYRSSNIGAVDSWAYNIQPWAYSQLLKNPHLLENKLSVLEKKVNQLEIDRKDYALHSW